MLRANLAVGEVEVVERVSQENAVELLQPIAIVVHKDVNTSISADNILLDPVPSISEFRESRFLKKQRSRLQTQQQKTDYLVRCNAFPLAPVCFILLRLLR